MHLEPLFDAEWRYASLAVVASSAAGDGRMYGVGDATISGERVSGTASWSNFPRIRGDGAFLPDARGAITTDDGANILFALSGRAAPAGGHAVHSVVFFADGDRYGWLNEIVAVGDGSVDAAAGILR
ncbi:MAG TPA: hypothetical protein VMQ81_05150, partial [Acidimicrobiia bacterium]|nr:hypothetical protein [Acidimicrobiia bacterium]